MGNNNLLPIFFALAFLWLAASCGNKEPDHVMLFDGHRYLLFSGENEIRKNGDDVIVSDSLKQAFEKPNLILFKRIVHPDYDTYIYIDLDSLPSNNFTESKEIKGKQVIFHQQLVDPTSEVTVITKLKSDKYQSRFQGDSINNHRFIIIPLKDE